MPGIARVKSITARGSDGDRSLLDWRANIEPDPQMVQSRVSRLSSTLPPGATVTRRGAADIRRFPDHAYSVTSPKRDPGTLRTLVELTIRPPRPAFRECRR